MIRKILIIIIAFVNFIECNANKSYSLSELLDIYFNINDTLKNKYYVKISYGPVNFSFNNDFKEKFSISYCSKLHYGFFRKKYYDNPKILSHSSEYISIENNSSHFKPKIFAKGNLTIDGWGISFGSRNGYGYILPSAGELLLNHEAALNWQRIDFEIMANNIELQAYQNKFDEKFKFGYFYSGGLDWQFSYNFSLGIAYNSNIIFNNTNTKNFLQILLFDNLFQFWIEFFDPILREKYQSYYPLVKWIYKNTLSYLFIKIRTQKEYFPFENSKIPLNSVGFTISVTYLFE